MVAKKNAKMGKKVAPAPLGTAAVAKVKKDPKFEKRARSFRIGADIQPKRDLTRFVRWPKYVRLQRQKRIMLERLRTPPSIAQFHKKQALDKNQFVALVRLLKKIAPESRAQKRERHLEEAAAKEAGTPLQSKAPIVLKYGLKHVTQLIEEKKAKLVVISHDVDPVELVCWLPALCRKKDVPYCVVRGKARLGQLVHKKTATCVAVTQVEKGDINELEKLCESFRASFNDNHKLQIMKGGGEMGVKSKHVMKKREQALQKEADKKAGLTI